MRLLRLATWGGGHVLQSAPQRLMQWRATYRLSPDIPRPFPTLPRSQGSVLLCRQRDQPGIVGAIGTLLAADNVNISFMTVTRSARNEEAIMAIGIDDEPPAEVRARALLQIVHGLWYCRACLLVVLLMAFAELLVVQGIDQVVIAFIARVLPFVDCCIIISPFNAPACPPLTPSLPFCRCSPQTLKKISQVKGISEWTIFKEIL